MRNADKKMNDKKEIMNFQDLYIWQKSMSLVKEPFAKLIYLKFSILYIVCIGIAYTI